MPSPTDKYRERVESLTMKLASELNDLYVMCEENWMKQYEDLEKRCYAKNEESKGQN